MKTFILHFAHGSTLNVREMEVRGESIAEAIKNSELDSRNYRYIDSHEVEGKRVEVASQSNCGCWYHAEEGLSCSHDLATIGLVDLSPHGTNVKLDDSYEELDDSYGFELTDDELAAE